MDDDEVNERPYICDMCDQRAWVEVFIGSISNCFLFCGHCYTQREAQFEARTDVMMILDNRDQIA